jgi:hypothetical protein
MPPSKQLFFVTFNGVYSYILSLHKKTKIFIRKYDKKILRFLLLDSVMPHIELFGLSKKRFLLFKGPGPEVIKKIFGNRRKCGVFKGL